VGPTSQDPMRLGLRFFSSIFILNYRRHAIYNLNFDNRKVAGKSGQGCLTSKNYFQPFFDSKHPKDLVNLFILSNN
jgi:hypothetical protein